MRRFKWIAALVMVVVTMAPPASAQRRAGSPRSAPGPVTMQLGLAAGAAGVDVRRSRADWNFGPLLGARWSWTNQRSGAFVALDVQPFLADGGGTAGRYRSALLLPSYEIRAGAAGVRAGIGLGVFRFENALLGDRTDYTTVTGVGGSVQLPSSLALEIAWRRTGIVRGFQSNVLSIQLTRMWIL